MLKAKGADAGRQYPLITNPGKPTPFAVRLVKRRRWWMLNTKGADAERQDPLITNPEKPTPFAVRPVKRRR